MIKLSPAEAIPPKQTQETHMIILVLIAALIASIAAGSFGYAMAGYVMAGKIDDIDRIHRDLAITKTLRG